MNGLAQWQPQLGPQQELPDGGDGLPDFPLDNTPKPPSTTRRMGSPVSGCLASGASVMLCLNSECRGLSPSFDGMVS